MALARSKGLFAAAVEMPSAVEGARSPLAAHTESLTRGSALRDYPMR